MHHLTAEQLRVVGHPLGHHARVLAVAGSGKTETLARRIAHLASHGVPADKLLVMQFNRLARAQFRERLARLGVHDAYSARVHTFHSYASGLIGRAVTAGFLPTHPVYWVDGRAEEARIHAHRAIRELERRGEIAPDSVDVETLLEAISSWKSALVPPARAGYRGNPDMVAVYAEFEKLRIARGALTFDDFVPLVVGLLEAEPDARSRWTGTVDHLLVDEAQDLNLGQVRLVQVLAGTRADVMVCGDDDQTIYEWRGARPLMLNGDFATLFEGKPSDVYTLSRSFRFGPVLAQAAFNVIGRNAQRVPKPLVAHDTTRVSTVTVVEAHAGQTVDAERDLVDHLFACVREGGDPREVAVLGRTYGQLLGIEVELLARGVPYRVVGREPFFSRREIRVLLDYAHLGLALDSKMTKKNAVLLKSVANVPNRRIRHADIEDMVDRARRAKQTLRQMLEYAEDEHTSFLPRAKREAFSGLIDILFRIDERLTGEPGLTACEFFTWLIDAVDYERHFVNYYGPGLDSTDRLNTVRSFCGAFARRDGKTVGEFLATIARLDTTQGRPIEEQIVVTTAFKAKGLEYDHVIIPDCVEGAMPCLNSVESPTFDKAGIVPLAPPSSLIEAERRLFYVAVTRARMSVTIGTRAEPRGDAGGRTPPRPSRFVSELMLDETRAIMPIVADIVAGRPDAVDRLVAEFTKTGRIHALWTNIRNGYLAGCLSEFEIKRLDAEIAKFPDRAVVHEVPGAAPDDDDQDQDDDGDVEAAGLRWWEKYA